ncbi:hypothetical protein OKA04_04490 [Luteolibacter flavescens]|uniref:Uncharacterized protein n=1 Tax=Luteolibacter flavescens TaxID=1859460 RepID=A0ABT3FK78_9BACT|nr:hypothetical protein [Luteolibacter flavescens]MCW1883974.1 hypothetical protein [Luteolibacter flavescens]
MSAKPTAPRAARKTAAKAPRKPRGNISRAEIQPLVLEAKAAFDMQIELANLDHTTSFDDWRREQVMAAVGKPGLTALDHDDFNPVMAHFATLAGHDDKALARLMKTGPATRDQDDTHERRRQLAHLIATELATHIRLGEISAVDLAAETADTGTYQRLRAAREAIRAHKDGPIREGYLIFLARQKTRRPQLTLGRDLEAGLADRCTVDQLTQLLSTLRNRIATREGRADAGKRAPGTARRKARKKATERALDTPAGTASRVAKPSADDPF